MRSDPRLGLAIALVLAAAAASWLVGLIVADAAIWRLFGFTSHAITFLSIFVLLAAAAAVLVFRRFAAVRTDLLAGRDVLARWQVDAAAWRAFAAVAQKRQHEAKLAVFYTVLFFVLVICGGLALVKHDDAAIFLLIGVFMASVVAVAYRFVTRIDRRHLEPRTCEVIVGSRGLIVNGVLHVWDLFLSRLVGAAVEPGSPPILVVTYAYWARFGPQCVAVALPVPAEKADFVRVVERRLQEIAVRQPRRRARPRRMGIGMKHSAWALAALVLLSAGAAMASSPVPCAIAPCVHNSL